MKARAEKLLAQVQAVRKIPSVNFTKKVSETEKLIEEYARFVAELAGQVEALTAIVAQEQQHGVGHG